jgi:hypothetical protein
MLTKILENPSTERKKYVYMCVKNSGKLPSLEKEHEPGPASGHHL